MQQKPGFSKSCVVVGVLLAASLAARQADQKPPAARSTMSGVYSAEQAAKGEELYLTLCTGCHSSRTYASLATAWTGRPVLELFDLVQTTMPKNDAGSLTSEETARILAFMLKINRVPAGKTELSVNRTELAQIRFEFPTGLTGAIPRALTSPARAPRRPS